MEQYITVEELKKQANIDFNDDDEYLTSLIAVAQDILEKDLQRPLTDEACQRDGTLCPALKHALKIRAATLYNNREDVAFATPSPVPFTYGYLIGPYKKYT